MYDESKEPLLANGKLREVVDNAKKEADFLVKLLGDEQFAADESWARVQSCLLILRYSLAAKLIYFSQTIAPSVVVPFASEFDDIMRETYMKIADIENINEEQKVQLSLPLRHGGCGLRTHAISELQRLFVSSAMLVAPAVADATGFAVAPSEPNAEIEGEDDTFSPFESCLQSCITDLHSQGISKPNFLTRKPGLC